MSGVRRPRNARQSITLLFPACCSRFNRAFRVKPGGIARITLLCEKPRSEGTMGEAQPRPAPAISHQAHSALFRDRQFLPVRWQFRKQSGRSRRR
ncbi:hypothetical protein APASM_4067 [Actinosynnema pretiosum subsp. pretiosum]|nr:hypothetical protein APASM_4067 [Actinosynnema pretiosum subsp. pretiosum]